MGETLFKLLLIIMVSALVYFGLRVIADKSNAYFYEQESQLVADGGEMI